MPSFKRGLLLGLVAASLGLVISLFPFWTDLEETIGLDLLFRLRGSRQPPSDVLIVSIDRPSAERLDLPTNLRKWPRSVHARLVENLARRGASVIAFDLSFEEARSPEEDTVLAEAIRRAGNVVLCCLLKGEKIAITDGGNSAGSLGIVKLIPPISPLAEAAAARAPFPLPKLPVKVSRYWTFKTEAGDVPTIPVVAFHLFSVQWHDAFITLLKNIDSEEVRTIFQDGKGSGSLQNTETLVAKIRDFFEKQPLSPEKMLAGLQQLEARSPDGQESKILKSLIRLYASGNSQYLNFYGPTRTIPTLSYDEALAPKGPLLDLKGKAVFVGHSPISPSEQKESFYTVFTNADGVDISGVEIAATAFANLLEDRPVRPLGLGAKIGFILSVGIFAGLLCRLLPIPYAGATAATLGVLYLLVAEFQFKSQAIWYPIVLPLFLQIPFAFSGAVLLRYRETTRERHRIKKTLETYLPARLVNQLAKNIADLKASNQMVYGICLLTDAERYTSLSEHMDPQELTAFMNRYYETIFQPVVKSGGMVANIVGDSMLAIWVAGDTDLTLRNKALLAALEVKNQIDLFNQSSPFVLPTRIGLHSGRMLLGSIGSPDHYEYRPIGDIINTSERIQALNKNLGTRILVSEQVISGSDTFLTRETGKFLLAGKSQPVVIHELIALHTEGPGHQKTLCTAFSKALVAFRAQDWDRAAEQFQQCIQYAGEDKPSEFYVRLCREYRTNPPGTSWDGAVHIEKN